MHRFDSEFDGFWRRFVFVEQRRDDGFDRRFTNLDDDLYGDGDERGGLHGDRPSDGHGKSNADGQRRSRPNNLFWKLGDVDGFGRRFVPLVERCNDGFDDCFTDGQHDLYGDGFQRGGLLGD